MTARARTTPAAVADGVWRLTLGRPLKINGPLHVARTLVEGDPVGEGFEVVHLPGHAPGCIGLWRASYRLALSNDCFALFDPSFPRPGRPRIPHPAFNWSTECVPGSIAKLAALEPRTCWPGHFGPLTATSPQLRPLT